MLEAGKRLSTAWLSVAGGGAAPGGRPIGRSALGQGSVHIPAGKLHVPLNHAVDAPLPLEREVDADLSKQRARWPGEVVRVAREAVAGGLAGCEHGTAVPAAARRVDHVGRQLTVDRSAELVHGKDV